MKVGIVSVYPPPNSKHARLGGVASYTKNLVLSLLDHCSVIVFADRVSTAKDEYYEGAVVCRCWNKSLLYPFQIFRNLLNKKMDVVHVQHETYLYGGLGSAIVFPLLLALVKLLRNPVIVTLHGVVPLSIISKKFLKENWIRGDPTVMKVGLASLMKFTTLFSDAIIVHDEKLKEVLSCEYGCDARKIHVIHHGIEAKKDLVSKDEAKERLGLSEKKVVLFFGYVTGYKNLELLIDCVEFLKTPEYVLIIAGGPHPRLKSDTDYRRYFSYLNEKALTTSKDRILFKGFIPEEYVSLYFSATDLVVFPYTNAISSSGPMCLAVSYRVPFIASKNFSHMVKNEDLTFRLHPTDLASSIENFFLVESIRYKALEHIERLANERSWSSVTGKTVDLYNTVIQRAQEV